VCATSAFSRGPFFFPSLPSPSPPPPAARPAASHRARISVRVPLPAAGVAGVFLLAVPQLLNRFIGDRVYLLRGETQRDKDIAPMDLFTAGARGAPPPPPFPVSGPAARPGFL